MQWIKSVLLALVAVLGSGLVLGLSIWHERLPDKAGVNNVEISTEPILLGEQSVYVEAWPGSWRYVVQRIEDRWYLLQTRDHVAKTRLLFDLVDRRNQLTQTLIVHGKQTQAVDTVERAGGYWVWAMREMKNLSNEQQLSFQEASQSTAKDLEQHLQLLLELAPMDRRRMIQNVLDQIMAEKHYWE